MEYWSPMIAISKSEASTARSTSWKSASPGVPKRFGVWQTSVVTATWTLGALLLDIDLDVARARLGPVFSSLHARTAAARVTVLVDVGVDLGELEVIEVRPGG